MIAAAATAIASAAGSSEKGWMYRVGSGTSSTAPMAVQTYPALGNTGPQSKAIAWTGFSIDTRDSTVYSAANGGHTDYAGNEVNRIRLSDNAPAWTEPHAATPMRSGASARKLLP